MRTVEQLLISPPSSFNRAEWGLLYLEGKVNGYWPNPVSSTKVRTYYSIMRDLKTAHYSSLSKEEWEYLASEGIVNWFWPASHPILGWLLDRIWPCFRRSSANIHDLTYWQGTYPLYSEEYIEKLKIENPERLREIQEAQRKKCDEGFYLRLCQDSLDTKWKMPYYLFLSFAYYLAVRTMGYKYFNYD